MKILEARNSQPDSTLADLYCPGNMPPELIKAHRELDKAIDSVFSSKRLRGVQERREVLLKAYEKMTGEEGE